MWLLLSIFSSIFLGSYDLLKKWSLRANAFVPVLFLATLTGAIAFAFFVLCSHFQLFDESNLFYVPRVPAEQHALFFLKAVIVGISWYLSFMALSHLPITIVVPIRVTGPFWVLIGSLIIFQERFTTLQWAGIITVLVFFYIFSLAGQKEGIRFIRNKWIYAIVAATMLGAVSGLFDKHLLMHYNRMAVQAWFSIYMVAIMLPFLLLLWYPRRKVLPRFQWRWSIPAIGLVLATADFLYFLALSDPESLIGIVSLVRRSSVVLSFSLGAMIFKEGNIRKKAYALIGILLGMVLLIAGS